MTPVKTLWIALLASYIAGTRRRYGSVAKSVRLTTPPVDLPRDTWKEVAEHILDIRPRWQEVELIDAANRHVAKAVRRS